MGTGLGVVIPPKPFPPLLGLLCVLALHGPDGSALYVLSDSVKAIRPIAARHRDHVASGIRAVIYTGVSPTGFGVAEEAGEVLRLIRCGAP